MFLTCKLKQLDYFLSVNINWEYSTIIFKIISETMKFEVCVLLATLAQVVNAVEKAWCNNEAEDGAMSFLGSTKF